LPQALVGDGRPPLAALALGLVAAGCSALYLSATRRFLPHDEAFLGMTAEELCSKHGCRVVHFMVHDRAAFGGVVLAIGLLYLWIVAFPLRERARWAWWAILLSGLVGFGSFLAYIGYGYLDEWHGVATLALLPCFVLGIIRTGRRRRNSEWNCPAWRSTHGIGRACLVCAAAGATVAGLVILVIGMSFVFVPQDLDYLGVEVEELRALNPRLVPLIAHDRAGFGGAIVSCGLATSMSVWFGRPSRALWQALLLVGVAGFGPAIGVHFWIGYTDPIHLAPAVGGAALYTVGLALTFRPMWSR
jgi:hypothetical protein